MTESAARSVEQATKRGMEVFEGGTDDVRHPYYDLYVELSKAVGRPVKDLISPVFFEKLVQSGPRRARIFFVRQAGEVICGTVMGYGKGECHRVHSAYRFNHVSYYAMNLLMWHIFQDAGRLGYRHVNLGASRPGDAASDKYKEIFETTRLDYGYYIYESPWWRRGRSLRRVIPV
jgi:hypothetical protein